MVVGPVDHVVDLEILEILQHLTAILQNFFNSAGTGGADLHVIMSVGTGVIFAHNGVGRTKFLGGALECLVGQHGQRAAHADLIGVFEHSPQTLYQLLSTLVFHGIIVVHIEPYQEAVTAAHCQILDDLVDLPDGGVVVEVVEVGCEIHTAQGLGGGEVDALGEWGETASGVEFRLQHKPAECSVSRAVIGGDDVGAVGLCSYDISVVFKASVEDYRDGVAVVLGQAQVAKGKHSLGGVMQHGEAVCAHAEIYKLEGCYHFCDLLFVLTSLYNSKK